MIRVMCAAALFLSALNLIAGQNATAARDNAAEYRISACLQFDGPVDFAVVSVGKIVASDLFHRIGVWLRWKCPDEAAASPDGEILIRFIDNAPPDVHRNALAYARPYATDGVRIIVFYDRFEPLIANRPVEANSVLGYVFAHEIGHVLLGTDGHQPEGLMRARWTNRDFHSMQERTMGFDREDGEMIRDNLKMRLERHLRASAAALPAVTPKPNLPAPLPKPTSLAPLPPETQIHPAGDSRRRGTE